MARPSKFTKKLAEEICVRIMDGESLRRICADENMPVRDTIYRWMLQFKSFSDQYARAREIQAETMADQIVDIADDGLNDTYIDPKTGATMVDHDVIQRSKLRVDARKWVASKLAPKKYGEKIVQEITGKDGAPIEQRVTAINEQAVKSTLDKLESEY